jgi:Putative bacterial sensory transduction regulator
MITSAVKFGSAIALGAFLAMNAHGQSTPSLEVPAGTGQTMAALPDLLDGLTIDELEVVVKEAGYAYSRVTSDGKESIDAATKDGLKFSFFLVDCPTGDKPRCASLNLSSFLFLENVNVTLRGVNEWNRSAWGVRGVLYTDGTSGMIMNLAVDGGVSKKWLLNRFTNFDFYIKSYSDFTQGIKPAQSP